MKSRHCASVWLLIQHINTGPPNHRSSFIQTPPEESHFLLTIMWKFSSLKKEERKKDRQEGTGTLTWEIPKPSPKLCVNAHQTPHWSFEPTRSFFIKTSSPQRRRNTQIFSPWWSSWTGISLGAIRWRFGSSWDADTNSPPIQVRQKKKQPGEN